MADVNTNTTSTDGQNGDANFQANANQDVNTGNQNKDDNPSIDDLMKQLAEQRAENARQKAALDKALKEVGDKNKELRSYKTQAQIDAEDAAQKAEEQKAYVAELEAYKHKNEAKERYLLQGMSAELAAKAAEAEVGGDMDALADIQRQHTEALIKAKEAEWKKSRPQMNAGEGGTTMTKEEIFAIKDAAERQRAIAENLALFQQ